MTTDTNGGMGTVTAYTGRGGAARGYSWPTATAGNTIAMTHGSYAVLALSPVAAETADVLREMVPVYDVADEPALQAFGLILEQLKAAAAALELASAEGRREDALALSRDARGWLTSALKYSEQFGMTPRSRVALGLDLVRGRAATLTLTRLAAMADADDNDQETTT